MTKDTTSIKLKPYISSDGGTWISSCTNVFPTAITVLDKFHCNKALTYIFGRSKVKRNTLDYLKNDAIHDFKTLVGIQISLFPQKEKYINNHANYLINHINNIKNQDDKHYKVSCSMEGHVSHVLANYMSSRPKDTHH